ncbi:hypothetical protein [Oceanicoccus sp. KOV_DT_Chl]|uniref:hypothetical protein n=1 Tax=Oceanicoccus sp. KOV_DT_Chl TaxID=1904639 RepID=UPI000C7B3C80|nr:hypothetical protein [Oceanicoccus sp. KOV_DT_Chl]
MKEVLENLPDIIKASSESSLGVVALMLILFSALSWGFFRRSSEKWKVTSLAMFFLGCILFGYTAFKTSQDSLVFNTATPTNTNLTSSLSNWVQEAEAARKAKTISSTSPLPVDLVSTRNQFEKDWRNSSLNERKKLDVEMAYKALSYANRLYRVVEADSSVKTNAVYWANESIRFFEEIQDPKYLTEALIDKAALYLDISQLGHNDKQQFEEVAKDGDAVMTRAFKTADVDQQAIVLRISSRFYYNLARPASFRLSDDWDNNYLLLAYEKALKAFNLSPEDSKSANQLARVTIKASKNPPQDIDPAWTEKLRNSKEKLKEAWIQSQASRTDSLERLSPLNVLGVVTLETVSREWQELNLEQRRTASGKYRDELEEDSIAPLREAAALLNNTQLRKAYGFDIYYDIARAHSVKTDVVRQISEPQSIGAFSEVKKNLATAKENAKTSQLEASVKDISNEITFSFLSPIEKEELKNVLSIGL